MLMSDRVYHAERQHCSSVSSLCETVSPLYENKTSGSEEWVGFLCFTKQKTTKKKKKKKRNMAVNMAANY